MVAIRDMEMPNCCMNCGLLGIEEMYCTIYPRRDLDVITVATNRPNCCPIVEIVTCKDCSHYTEYKALDGITYVGCDKGHSNLSPNFYCAEAERRENETN